MLHRGIGRKYPVKTFRALPGSASFTGQAINLNSAGTAAYLQKASPTGFTDAVGGSFFCWLYIDALPAVNFTLFDEAFAGISRTNFIIDPNLGFTLGIRNTGGGTLTYSSDATLTSQVIPFKTWFPIFISWNLQTTAVAVVANVYIGDMVVPLTAGGSYTGPQTALHTAATVTIGNNLAATNAPGLGTGIAEVWYDPTTYIDFSVQANRRKFINDSWQTISLGATGSLPTGTAPKIYFTGDASVWANNASGGSAFTVTNSIVNYASNPPNTSTVYAGGSPVIYSPSAAAGGFNGKRLARSSALSNAASASLTMTISVWFKLLGISTVRSVFDFRQSALYGTRLTINAAGTVSFAMREISGITAEVLYVSTANAFTYNVWHNLLLSCSMTTGTNPIPTSTCRMYNDGVSMTPSGSIVSGTFTGAGFNSTTLEIFRNQDTTNPFRGELAELYINCNDYIDFSVGSNRDKFIAAGNVPANLGATGSTPTGTLPLVYLRGPNYRWGINSTGNGDFTLGTTYPGIGTTTVTF